MIKLIFSHKDIINICKLQDETFPKQRWKWPMHGARRKDMYDLFLLNFFPTLAEIAIISGYDFVIIDMEHNLGNISDALNCHLPNQFHMGLAPTFERLHL
ncbi:Pyruvate/Phosphoenolpyruvate kinase-like domain containing protein [Parasponia andersonii]|uniref:Pyruvate/Phosphoenolpyruvate kinase-like domain containing protein n=1 Tax=Parasponia andersonii TaxID=3476 RepID=A0A2P5DKU9_PARAD|nr:Pyruvate/Phosphoenolpyruvate kinase-like domain containing protein [Parasponia andersonii]